MGEYRVSYETLNGIIEGGYTRPSMQSAWDTALKTRTNPKAERVMIERYDDRSDEWREIISDMRVNSNGMLSVSQIAAMTGFDRSYIKAEIVRGNLKADLIGNSYVVSELDSLLFWLDNPQRGNRSE